MKEFLIILEKILFLTPLIAFFGFFLGLFYFKKLSKGYKILTFLFFYSFLNEIFSHLSAKFIGSNLIFLNIYATAELIFLYTFLNTYKSAYKLLFKISFIIIMLFNIYELLGIDYQNFVLFQTYSRSINSIFLLIMTISIILNKLNEDDFRKEDKILYAVLCFLVVSASIFLPLNLLINFVDFKVFIVWIINTLNVIVFFSCIIYQIWKLGKLPKI